MKNNITITTAGPSAEPLTTAIVDEYLRIDGTSEDPFVSTLITAARVMAEKYTSRYLITQTVTLTMDRFPVGGFRFPIGPVQSVTSIEVTDSSGTQTTWDASNYFVDTQGQRIVYTPGAAFPTSYNVANSVVVTYVAGYGDSGAAVPGTITQGMLHLIAHMWENREIAQDIPPAVQVLWNSYKKIYI